MWPAISLSSFLRTARYGPAGGVFQRDKVRAESIATLMGVRRIRGRRFGPVPGKEFVSGRLTQLGRCLAPTCLLASPVAPPRRRARRSQYRGARRPGGLSAPRAAYP